MPTGPEWTDVPDDGHRFAGNWFDPNRPVDGVYLGHVRRLATEWRDTPMRMWRENEDGSFDQWDPERGEWVPFEPDGTLHEWDWREFDADDLRSMHPEASWLYVGPTRVMQAKALSLRVVNWLLWNLRGRP